MCVRAFYSSGELHYTQLLPSVSLIDIFKLLSLHCIHGWLNDRIVQHAESCSIGPANLIIVGLMKLFLIGCILNAIHWTMRIIIYRLIRFSMLLASLVYSIELYQHTSAFPCRPTVLSVEYILKSRSRSALTFTVSQILQRIYPYRSIAGKNKNISG